MASRFDFGAIAEMYDAWYSTPVGKKIDLQEKNAVRRFLPSPDTHRRVLEVGPGTGHWTSWFAEAGFHVTGVEISPEMTAVAENKNIPHTEFICGDFTSTDIPGDFDMAVAITSLEFIPEYVSALEKMKASVRPGGIILVGVLNRFSYMGLSRKIKGAKDPVFYSAHFFSYGEIKKILKTLGPAVVTGSTFALPHPTLLWTAGFFEAVGTRVTPFFGNFLAGRVML